ncbi:hypothetical protein [Pedobacter sp.]|uniref:hypothetical protein n=1 Tax=Pedobacter sp. TaxID=1411316 RepID=UPI0031E064F4
MKKFLSILVLSFSLACAFGSDHQQTKPNNTLLKVKNVLEKHLAGTNIRDLGTGFTIDKIQSSNSYEIKGDIISMLPSSQVKLIHHILNKALKNYPNLKLDGSIYFDRYIDSVLVNVSHRRTDTIFDFHPTPIPLEPREGYANFSKELHDVIKLKFKEGKISKNGVLSINNISFTVDLSGKITRNNKDDLKNELDSFLNAKRWKRSAFSSYFVMAQVTFALNQDYLIKDGNWYKPYITNNGNNYGDGWANLNLITPSSIGSQTTFFSYQKPTSTWNHKSLLSIVYDQALNKFRMPVIHFGSQEETQQLIDDLNNISSSNRDFFNFYNRVYLYRLK